jgi:hypothetical protein
LDQAKELYFTEESFDDFYYGKGSTYPDAHGSIGILFEQASSRGHAQESINGLVEFPRTIQNQFITSLSTFAGAMANKAAIAAYQRQFYRDTQALIKDDDLHGFIVKAPKDNTRFERMLSIFKAHKIVYQLVSDSVTFDGVSYDKNDSIYVPLDQPQYRLIRSLFSERTRFVDNTFYDVSNWNIALAFNLDYHDVTQSERRKVKAGDNDWPSQKVAQAIDDEAYAYVFEWHSANAPAMLQSLLEKDVQIRVAGAGFTAKRNGDTQAFAPGSIMIPSALKQPEDLAVLLSQAQEEFGVAIHNISSGLTPSGIDLGSRQFTPVKLPQVLLVGGVGTSSLEVGEIRHYLDTRIGLPATLVDLQNLGSLSLDRYTHIVFASGSYNSVDAKVTKGIEEWVKQGGVLIGQKSALTWFAKNNWIDNEVVSSEAIDKSFPTTDLQFKDMDDLAAKKRVAGAVFMAEIDRSNPIFFGFERDVLPLFKTSNLVIQNTDDPFIEAANYLEKPLAAGYASDEIEELVSKTPAVIAKSTGRGVVIGFVDNVHFRGYWDGTNKLMANAIYMSPLL